MATFNQWQISAVVMSKGIGDTLMHWDRPAVKLGSSAVGFPTGCPFWP